MAAEQQIPVIEGEATYQGIPCLSAEYTTAPGSTSDTGSVVIAARRMTAVRIVVSKALFTDRPFPRRQDTIPRVPDLATAPQAGITLGPDGVVESATLVPFGSLILRSTVGERRVDALMPLEIEPIDQAEDGLVLYRIQLGDVRTIWPHRGVLFGDYNHVSDGGAPVADIPSASLAFLLEWVGAALPGIARLEMSPVVAKAAAATFPPNIRWRFDNPAREFDRLLHDHDLHPVLDHEGRVLRIYARGEGLQVPAALGISEELLHAVAAPSLSLVPDAVLVVGAPRQREVELRLSGAEAMIGLAAPEGEDALIPWRAAVATYGLTIETASRWVLQQPEKQAAMLARVGAVDDAEARRRAGRLRRWLFRWYRLPEEQTHTLPILPLLEPSTGEELPPRVWADAVEELQGEEGEEPLGAAPRRWGNSSGVAWSPEEVQIDARAGVLRFGSEVPPGSLMTASVATLEEGSLYPPEIRLRYRTERKDGRIRSGEVKDKTVPYALAPDDYFLFALQRRGTEAREAPPLSLEASPLVIQAPELVELERVDGGSNRQELRRRAAEIAAGYFRQSPVVATYDVRAAGVHPVWPDGSVAQVRWRVSESEASTEVVIQSYRRSIDATAPTYAAKRFAGTVAKVQDAGSPPAQVERTARGPGWYGGRGG